HDAVLALEEKYRLPIILHYMSGYTTEEIGRILHLPTGTVRSRLKRARERLKTELESQ
ncbi:MAG: sigma-70 family RNA polymerase sigma factor, partial [Firmicutes bacterium]|nr:sigma-70 family RNA polymerase sigma factor [Bacillota bacterium]